MGKILKLKDAIRQAQQASRKFAGKIIYVNKQSPIGYKTSLDKNESTHSAYRHGSEILP